MKRFRFFPPRPNRRATLLDLHRFGIIRVFRRHSILRAWQPLRETTPTEFSAD